MTTNSPFPWLATAEPTPPHPAAAGSPPAGVTADQLGGADGWPPENSPPGWGPPAPARRPAAVDDTASGRGAAARTTSAGWPLPSGALTHHPAADPGELGGHGAIATVDGRQDPPLADDLASPDDQPAAPAAEPRPPRAPADGPARDTSRLGGPTGLAPVLHSRPDEAEPASPTADQWPAPGPDGTTGPPAPPAQRHPAEDRRDLAASLVTAAAGREGSAAAAFSERGREDRMRPERRAPAVSKTAAVAIATRFTADVLSWDEDAPEVRAAALRAYAGDGGNAAAAGWEGLGRQRVDLVLPPEEVLRLATGELVVSLTARVVTYFRTAAVWSDPTLTGSGAHASAVPRDAVAPAAAPSPDTPGWAAVQAYWITISTVVHRAEAGHLVVELA
jgi:hypothetical protein